jgi:VWFA-related protein
MKTSLVLLVLLFPSAAHAGEVVELYATVQDRQGRPVTGGLDREAFIVLEDGVPQRVLAVEPAGEEPLRVVTLIDCSRSMKEEIEPARQAALSFLHSLLRPRDQAAVIAFNDSQRILVPFTSDLDELKKGFRKIRPTSETALYDSLVRSLFYLAKAGGQRALLLLTDGKDQGSQLTYVEALETVRRMGIGIYVIGLGAPDGPRDDVVPRLIQLAEVTGGQSFFVKTVSELPDVYAQIGTGLRARYRISYQSSSSRADDHFRAVQVEMAKEGMEARTISGYYP